MEPETATQYTQIHCGSLAYPFSGCCLCGQTLGIELAHLDHNSTNNDADNLAWLLRIVLGKLEEKRSLGTKNASEAKVLLAQALSELDQKWANLRRGPKVLTETEAHELAAPVRWPIRHVM